MVIVIESVLLPFLGTVFGAACVFLMKETNLKLQRGLTGFAAGVMTAASIWSLLLPAVEAAENLGRLSFLPGLMGFWIGMVVLILPDKLIPHSNFGKTKKLFWAVTLHNIPEGMAVGAVCAGFISGEADVSVMGALALSLGIALQNFPDGAIVSMPFQAEGYGKMRSFSIGVLSGVVEPVAALITIIAAELLVPVLPYLLGFAAGAMFYVVVQELMSDTTPVLFGVGFSLMTVLDVALG
ncbi:MAG: ZIP family metal transporter [Ruminococcaceae bacterium]|nr:ZIP family metal transporter [Oscillospiraceae bacterium]